MSCSARLAGVRALHWGLCPGPPAVGWGHWLAGADPARLLLPRRTRRHPSGLVAQAHLAPWRPPALFAGAAFVQGRPTRARCCCACTTAVGPLSSALAASSWLLRLRCGRLAYFPRSEAVVERHQIERQAVAPAALDALEKRQAAELVENSYLGQAGHWVAPAVRPLGWDWRIGMAVIASFPAREVIISALGTIYSLGAGEDEGSESLRTTLAAATWPDGRPIYTLAVALSIMVFFALCAQCLSTLVVIKKETGSYRWALFSFGYMTISRLSRRAGDLPNRHGLGLLTWTGKRQWPSPLPRSPQRTCCGVWRGLFSATNPTATNLCRSGTRTTSCGDLYAYD